jgi:hypothetical protein
MPKAQRFIQRAVKPANEGRFTDFCRRHGSRGGVTNACIERGLASPSARVRHEAQFAKNMRTIAAEHERGR